MNPGYKEIFVLAFGAFHGHLEWLLLHLLAMMNLACDLQCLHLLFSIDALYGVCMAVLALVEDFAEKCNRDHNNRGSSGVGGGGI
jgi:hypothetical protein